MSISELQREIEDTALKFNFIRNTVKVDATDFSVKYRLMIDEDFYIQIYTNTRNGTTGLTLVLHGQRIYGRDSEDWKWHRHPFENPDVHDFSEEGSRKVTLEEFLQEVQDILEKVELI